MEDKVIETMTYIKSVSKKKRSIDKIKNTLNIGDENNVWSTENLPNLLQDVRDKNLIELADDAYKIKQTQKRKLVEEILGQLTSQCAPFSKSETLVIPENQKYPESLFLRKSLSTPELLPAQPPTPKRTVKYVGDNCTHNLVLFQKLFMKEMEEIKRFTKSTEGKFEELEMALLNISGKNNVSYKIIVRIPCYY